MIKRILAITSLFILLLTNVQAAMKDQHGFAIINDGSSVFLSHIPKYDDARRAQIIYEMEMIPERHLAFLQLVKAESIVTFKANQAFDLQPLINGLPLKVKGTVYAGHFDHGGWSVYKNFEIHFETQKYVRKFDSGDAPIEPASNLQTYDVIPLARGHRLWVHRLQEKPSYDHLLLTIDYVACPTTIRTTSSVPSEAEVYRRLSSCGSLKPLYYSAFDLQ